MKRFLFLALMICAMLGCGPSKTGIARSEVNQQAETWDGGPKFTAQGTDPWGEPYTSRVEKGDVYYHLTVRSNGPDRLPLNWDDVVASRHEKHTPLGEAAASSVEKLSEAAGRGLGRGGVGGIRDGLTGKKVDEKKGKEKND